MDGPAALIAANPGAVNRRCKEFSFDQQAANEEAAVIAEVATATAGVMDVVEISDEEFADEADNLDVQIAIPNVLNIREIVNLLGNTWKNQAIQGVLLAVYPQKQYYGTKPNNKNVLYQVRTLVLADLTDQSIQVRVSLWNTSIQHFINAKPKLQYALILRNVTIQRMDAEMAKRHNSIPFQINSNSTSSADFQDIATNPTFVMQKLNALNEGSIKKIYNFRATVLAVNLDRDDLKTATVKQGGGICFEIHFWMDNDKFQENLEQLKVGEFYEFHGLYLSKPNIFSASLFSKIRHLVRRRV